jgi:hypothetical protein
MRGISCKNFNLKEASLTFKLARLPPTTTTPSTASHAAGIRKDCPKKKKLNAPEMDVWRYG